MHASMQSAILYLNTCFACACLESIAKKENSVSTGIDTELKSHKNKLVRSCGTEAAGTSYSLVKL